MIPADSQPCSYKCSNNNWPNNFNCEQLQAEIKVDIVIRNKAWHSDYRRHMCCAIRELNKI